MENNSTSSGGKQKSKFLLLASVLLLLLIVLLVIIISQRNNQDGPVTQLPPTTTGNQVPPPMVKDVASSAIQAPQVSFGTWTGLQATATYPTSASVYTLKTNYTFDEAKAILNKLGFKSDVEAQGNAVVGYDSDGDGKNIAIAAVDLTNGNLAYNSTDGIKLPSGTTLEAKSISLLKTLGLYDNTLAAGAQYKSRKQAGKTFIEFHRSWEKVGLPIFNAVGLMNVSETQKLASLSIETASVNEPADADVYGTSDNSDGHMRSDNFNTITLAVSDADQTVTLIKSNIRPLATASPSTSSLISYDDAVAMLKAGTYEFIYTTPAGSGSGTPWETVFPQNKAEAQTATVTESLVVYLESHPNSTQDMLKPYFIFRGTAQLNSGYMASFVAAVPASNRTVGRSLIPAVHAQTDQGQKQSTFDMQKDQTSQVDNPLTPTSIPPVQVGSPLPPIAGDQSECEPPVSAMNPIINYGGTYFGLTLRPGREDYNWYYIPTAGNSVVDTVLITNLQTVVDQLKLALSGQSAVQVNQPPATQGAQNLTPTVYQTNVDDTGQKQSTFEVPTVAQVTYAPVIVEPRDLDIREFKNIIKDIQKQVDYCPVRFDGSSPSLFIYGTVNTTLNVSSGAQLTYSDPYIANGGTWNVTVGSNSLNINGVERQYVYYEHSNASFNRPESGWVISKSDVSTFVSTVLASSLNLNANEAERAVFELNHAAGKVDGDTIFVGLVSSEEVNAQLPLAVSPKPQVAYRYHFYVAEASANETVEAPALEAIARAPYMIVELGSYAGK